MSAPPAASPDPVATFVPWAGEGERKQRLRLLRAQSYASTNVHRYSSGRARELSWHIVSAAGQYAFAPATAEDLKDIADGLLRVAMTAAMFERLEGDAFDRMEGSDES